MNVVFSLYIIIDILLEIFSELNDHFCDFIIYLLLKYPKLNRYIRKPMLKERRTRVYFLWRQARIYVLKFIHELNADNNIMLLDEQEGF